MALLEPRDSYWPGFQYRTVRLLFKHNERTAMGTGMCTATSVCVTVPARRTTSADAARFVPTRPHRHG